MPFELIILVGILLFLYELISRSPTRKGRSGEAKVSAAIKANLPQEKYFLINDITLRSVQTGFQVRALPSRRSFK